MNNNRFVPTTLFLLRVVAGFLFLQVGGLKLFGWFGGIPGGGPLPPLIMTAGILEFFGGLAVLLGFFTRPIALILSGEMAVAYFIGHFPQGFWPVQNNGQPAVLFCFIFLFLAAYGAGKWSIDNRLRRRNNSTLPMNMLPNGFAVPLVVIITALVVIGGLIYYKGQISDKNETGETETATEKQNEQTQMMENKSITRYSGTVLAGSQAPLLDFKKADYDATKATDTLIVLYFYANWCPICKKEFPLMQAAFNELSTDNVVGFRVNYNDNETDSDEKNLAREFGVAYQHTKIFIKDGKRISKSPEGWDKNRYLTEINTLIAQ